MCAKVTSTYMEFTLAFGSKPEFSFSFNLFILSADSIILGIALQNKSSFLFAIHLPPVEDREFLLYIMLKLSSVQTLIGAHVCTYRYGRSEL